MLGWHVSVYTQKSGRAKPAEFDSPEGIRLAVWQTHVYGLRWLRDLVEAGRVVSLGGNGYPDKFTAKASELIPRFIDGPPEANKTWIHDPFDVILDNWEGKTKIDREATAACDPDEWLLVVVWDES